MAAHVYLRISEDKTGEELGVTRQREDCLTLARHRGWTVTREHPENDTSAAGGKARPRFDQLLAAVELGEVDAIIAWSLDRLTRNRRDTVRLIEACEPHRVVIALVRGSDLDMSTPAGRLTADILAGVARHEIEQKADRQRRASQQSAEGGKPPSGPVPFGFLPDRTTHHPEQAAAIKAAYKALLAGESLASIACRWNEAGLTSGRIRTGVIDTGEPSKWRAETVRAVLLKPRNAALRSYRGEVVGEAQWKPIVPVETFQAAVALLTDPGRRQAAPSTRGHLLSGIALCGVCGAPVNAGTRRPEYFAYRCRTAGHVARRGDHVDDYVRAVVVARLSRSDAVDLLRDDTRPDVGELRIRSLALRSRLDSLATGFADGELTASQLRTGTERIRAQITEVDAALAAAGQVDVLGDLAGVPDVAVVWDGLALDRQRAVIDALMTIGLHPPGQGARVFDPSSVRIEWRGAPA